jgi:hypothetical protein
MGEIACLFLSKLTNSNDFCGETGLTESKLSNLTSSFYENLLTCFWMDLDLDNEPNAKSCGK